MKIQKMMSEMGIKAREAGRSLARANPGDKNRALELIAAGLRESGEMLVSANLKDLQGGEKAGLSSAMLDRLRLTEKRIEDMALAVEEIAALPDPVGEITRVWTRPSGFRVGRMRVPIGVIGIIYESRPNVTIDAAALCLKSGNACILKGGSEALHSNRALADVFRNGVAEAALPGDAAQVVPTTDRRAVRALLTLDDYVDLIIPRGGKGLIRMIMKNSTIPVIKHLDGVCHTFVDDGAKIDMAVGICLNAKLERPGTCNAMETLLVHRDIAPDLLPPLLGRMKDEGVVIRGCPETCRIVDEVEEADEEDWAAEYLDKILAVRVVENMDAAMDHIARFGSAHTDVIVTENHRNAERFLREVDSAVVMVNASSRLNDGYVFGLGAEIGISTDKLHARGPMGLEELTCRKFIVLGDGHLRE
ncbi:MAG TPA: glutamate-5-semialdehyde dehydrogenase [Proteobacteria bacterium]|nr:gamma-glutamyl phosphate reductase [bacterium BMS3Abin14]HDL54306.1 glutamate-5-semialdehyde dehydrogenase [Pseudomonadota bacterium]